MSGIGAYAGKDRRWLFIAGTALLAIIVGMSFAGANWILIAALLAVPILLIRPREICLGCYAFLLPYDTISRVGPAGQTLTFVAGAAVLVVLLGTTMVKRDLRMPARPALWFTLFVAWAAVTLLWALEFELASRQLVTAVSLLVLYLVVISSNLSRKELQTVSLFAVAGDIDRVALYHLPIFLWRHQLSRRSARIADHGVDGDRSERLCGQPAVAAFVGGQRFPDPRQVVEETSLAGCGLDPWIWNPGDRFSRRHGRSCHHDRVFYVHPSGLAADDDSSGCDLRGPPILFARGILHSYEDHGGQRRSRADGGMARGPGGF